MLGGLIGRILLYTVFAGLTFRIVWRRRQAFFEKFRIYKNMPTEALLRHEVVSSVRTIAIWTVLSLPVVWLMKNGHVPYYASISDRGVPYYLLTVLGFIVFHDTYFYWTHRLMHHPKVFKLFHAGHHKSLSPSPWAVFSFQSAEAVVQFVVIFPLLLVPQHPSAIVLWNLWMIGFNVLGHLGYELFPRGFTRGAISGQLNTTTHHAMHHKYVVHNFSLYFTFWDRLMGTLHPRYHETFTGVTERGERF